MTYLNQFDYVVIVVYFSILVGLGLYLKKMASASLEDYFIGGRKIPWWALVCTNFLGWKAPHFLLKIQKRMSELDHANKNEDPRWYAVRRNESNP